MEDIIISFKDSRGKRYNWHIDQKFLKPGYRDESIKLIAHAITDMEMNYADDPEVHLQRDDYQIRKVNQAPRDPKKRNIKKIKRELAAAQPKAAPKPRSSHWIFTPNEVLRLKTESLIQRLLNYYEAGGDVDIFLGHLRMMKAIYNADCFDLGDRKIQGYFLGECLFKIFKYTNTWTQQMFLAYDEFNYFFKKSVRKSLQIIRRNEKKRLEREKVADIVVEDETLESATSTDARETLDIQEKEPRWNKKQRQLIDAIKKQPQQPKGYANQYFQF